MSTSIKLITIPKEGRALLQKAKNRGNTNEYSSVFFSIKRAFEKDFTTYGNSHWIEFKEDALELQKYYPSEKFESKYLFDTNGRYEVLEYLIAKYESIKFIEDKRIELSFFKGKGTVICQGRNFEYWDNVELDEKLKYIESINQNKLFEQYNPKMMKENGIYKMETGQDEKEYIMNMFEQLKIFLTTARKLNGYTLILQN